MHGRGVWVISDYHYGCIQIFASTMRYPSLYGLLMSNPLTNTPFGSSLSSPDVPYLRAHWPTPISNGYRATDAFLSALPIWSDKNVRPTCCRRSFRPGA